MRSPLAMGEMALAAGIAAAVAAAAAAFALWPSVESRRRQADEDVALLQRAIASMAIDFCGGGRPAFAETGCTDGSQPVYTFRMGWTAEELRPDLGIPGHLDPLDSMLRDRCLTTPTAYAQSYPTDPFTGDGYGYWPALAEEHHPTHWDGRMEGTYLVTSAGPDGRHEIDQRAVCLACLDAFAQRGGAGSGLAVSPEILSDLYDPTNGARSSGDLAWMCDGWEIQSLNVQRAP